MGDAMSPVIPQEQRPLIDRMREAVPGLEWRMSGSAVVVGLEDGYEVVTASPQRRLLCWKDKPSDPNAVRMAYPGDDEAVRIVSEWWAKVHTAPKLEALVVALTADGWECVVEGRVVKATRSQQRVVVGYVNGGFIVGDEQRPRSLEVVLDEIRERFPKPAHDPIAERGERLKALLPMLQWERLKRGEGWIGRNSTTNFCEVCVNDDGLVSAWTAERGQDHPSAIVDVEFDDHDELIALLTKWRDATYPKPEKVDTMTPEYRKFIDKVSEFVEAKWSLKDGDLICEARGRVYTIGCTGGSYTMRWTHDGTQWFSFGMNSLDQAVAALRHRMFQPTTKDRRASLADGIKRYLRGAVVSEGGADNWLSVDYEGARVAVTIDDRYTVRVHGQALGVSTDTEEGAIRIVRDTLLAEAQRIEHERVEAEIANLAPLLRPTSVQSDTQRNDVIAVFTAGTRAMQGILDIEDIDANLLRIVGQMDQYHVLNLTDPRTRKRHVIAYDGQWYLDGEPIIFDELLNEVLAIVTLEEEQEEPMSTRKTRAELAIEGAYLGAAKKTAEEARDAIAAMIASNLPAEKQENARGVIAELLQTKGGSGGVAWLLGEAIRQLPDPGAKADKFADSLMIVGAMQGTEQALDMVIEPLKALVSGAVAALPEPEKVRAVADETHEEAHEVPRRGKRAHA